MTVKIHLPEDRIPRKWYNLAADLPKPPLPPLGPDGNPVKPEMLAPVFPMNLIEQEMSTERWIDIPEPVLDILYRWRPSPLRRAVFLERHLKTPARIYYKDESLSPAGSHKPNTAVPQAWYNKEFGIERLTTETGAGQWGCALSFACKLIGLKCTIFMVRISFDQKPSRKMLMQLWGGECVPSPSPRTEFGRQVLEKDPQTPGSLGIAISEAIEECVKGGGRTRYCLGSVLNHVLLHQTIIGLEAREQMRIAGAKPDLVIGCVGGGSNFAGLAFPFIQDRINGSKVRVLGVEPSACPTLTRAPFVYDHGDSAKMTPLLPMHSLGHAFIPAPLHAGGLRYHGVAPLVSAAMNCGLMEAKAYQQTDCYKAAMTWAGTEGFVCAPETSHAVAAVIEEAIKAKEEGRERTILFCYSGHGLLDLAGYDKYMSGQLNDYSLPDSELRKSLDSIKGHPKPPKQ